MIKPEYTGCYNLVNNPEGWKQNQVVFDMAPYSMYAIDHPDDPKYAKLINHPSTTPENLRETLQKAHDATEEKRFMGGPDFDGLKATARRIALIDDRLLVQSRLTCYGVTWGLWGNPELRNVHNQGLMEMAEHHTTELPFGICLAPLLLTRDNLVIAVVRAFAQGFHAGRVSLSFEEQMDPERDPDPFVTAYNGYYEEFGLIIPSREMRLLGVEAEKSSAYTLWGIIGRTDRTGAQVINTWEHAKDRKEATALFLIPIDEASLFGREKITRAEYMPYLKGGEVPTTEDRQTLMPHPSNAWRADLLRDYLNAR